MIYLHRFSVYVLFIADEVNQSIIIRSELGSFKALSVYVPKIDSIKLLFFYNNQIFIIIRRYSLLVYLLIITVTISFTVARVELGKQKQRKLQCNT